MNSATDSKIQENVLAELRDEPSIDAAHIGVIVDDGVVTLTGHIPTHGEKVVAEEAAKRVRGVRAVADDLTVELREYHVKSDNEVARAVADALRWNSFVPANSVQAVVEDGWVMLDGEVEWQFQKEAAERAVSSLVGVRCITNNIRLKNVVEPKPHDVKVRILEALRRHGELEARRIGVDVSGTKIKLHGDVHSLSEVDAARRAAWSAPGVQSVECKLDVVP